MAKLGFSSGSTNPPYGGGEIAALAASTLLAFGTATLEAWRPLSLPDNAFSLLALFSLLLSTVLWARRPSGGAMLATFLPAIPLAAGVLMVEGGKMGAAALASTALAFQLRCLLLAFAAQQQNKREELSASLLSRIPEKVTVFIDNDIESEVKIDALREGHVFRLAPGQIVPADGLITFGSGFVDESFVSDAAENLKMKGMGCSIYAGTLNRNATLLVRVTSVGTQTFLARLATRVRWGNETAVLRLLAMDGVLTLSTVLFLLPSGPTVALQAFLVTSGVSLLAVLASFESSVSSICTYSRWLWNPGGLRRFAEAGMLVLRSEGVLSEGRPKLVALESQGHSEDAVLGMLAPLARKLETPAAFAVLQELRLRNIPLQPVEFYQPLADGAEGIVASDEVRWVNQLQRPEPLNYGSLDPFVREHLSAGDEIHFLEREGRLEAALAFRDSPIRGAAEYVNALRNISLPILLVSPLPRRAIARIQTEFSLEHAQGETSEPEIEALMDRLSGEGLAPAWVQTSSFRPRNAAAIAAYPLASTPGTDLVSIDLSLPELTTSLSFAKSAFRRLRSSQFWIFGSQVGLLLCLLSSNERLTGLLHLGRGWPVSDFALSLGGVLPGFLALIVTSRRSLK